MKKEVFVAIIIGIAIGAIITFGVHTAKVALQNQDQETEDVSNQIPSELTPSASNHLLTINSPHPDQIIEDDDIDITGITSSNSFISAISETSQAVAVADDQGNVVAGESVVAADAEGDVVAAADVAAGTVDDDDDAASS